MGLTSKRKWKEVQKTETKGRGSNRIVVFFFQVRRETFRLRHPEGSSNCEKGIGRILWVQKGLGRGEKGTPEWWGGGGGGCVLLNEGVIENQRGQQKGRHHDRAEVERESGWGRSYEPTQNSEARKGEHKGILSHIFLTRPERWS